MTPQEAEYVDRVGLFFELTGGTRTLGRIYGWLLICDPPEQSLTSLAETLSVSKASVSTVARQLQDGGMIERLPNATRQHHYRVTPGGFTAVMRVQMSRMGLGIDAADFGLSIVDEDLKEQRERLEDFRDFCAFSAKYFREEFMQKWIEYRESRRN